MTDEKLRAGLADRITKRAAELNLRQSDIVRATGAAKATVNRWFAGAIPRGEHAVALRKVLRVSQEWLDGTSSSVMVSNESQLFDVLSSTANAASMSELKTAYVSIPKYSPEKPDISDPRVFLKDVLPHDVVPLHLSWVQVVNDSAVPAFSRGDLVVLDADPDNGFVDNGYYAFLMAGSVSIFKVEFVPFDDMFVIKDSSGMISSMKADGKGIRALYPTFIGRVVCAVISA